MNYIGKLYGKLGNKYFDTGYTSEDYDLLTTSLAEANKQNSQLLLEKLERESDILALKEEIQMLNKKLGIAIKSNWIEKD